MPFYYRETFPIIQFCVDSTGKKVGFTVFAKKTSFLIWFFPNFLLKFIIIVLFVSFEIQLYFSSK